MKKETVMNDDRLDIPWAYSGSQRCSDCGLLIPLGYSKCSDCRELELAS